MNSLPLGLYIHIPWCKRKCPYCDFNSHATVEPPPEMEYVDALLTDLEQEQQRLAGQRLCSVFIGGGTPSLFSGAAIGRLLDGVARYFALDGVEITLEANPGAAEQARLRDYRSAGVNRLSLGAQSFDSGQLRALGRIHSVAEARLAVQSARRAGFDNINVDLMYGLPAQTPAQAVSDLNSALELQPEHVSWYQLSIEPNTVFWRSPPTAMPVSDVVVDIEEAGWERLETAGFARYEISAWSRPGRTCRHNLNYWEFGDYLGIGAGAHGKLTLAPAEVLRSSKPRLPAAYMHAAGSQVGAGAAMTTVPRDELPLEFMMNLLRLSARYPSEWYLQRTGLPLSGVRQVLAELRRHGLWEDEAELALSARGSRFLNDVLAAFMPSVPGEEAAAAGMIASDGRGLHGTELAGLGAARTGQIDC